MEKQYRNAQIIRKDGKDVIFEVLDYAFPIGKVAFNFAKYNKDAPAGQRMQGKVTIFMDFGETLKFVNDFTNTGNGVKRMLAEQKQAKEQGKNFWGTLLSLGGTSVEGLARQGRPRPDNKPEVRLLRIMPSYKGNGYALSAASGPGKVSATGGFTPDGKQDLMIQFAISYEDFAEVLLLTKASIEAYLASRYMMEPVGGNRPQNYNQQQNNYSRPQQNYNQQPQQQQPPAPPQPNYGTMGVSSSDPIVY